MVNLMFSTHQVIQRLSELSPSFRFSNFLCLLFLGGLMNLIADNHFPGSSEKLPPVTPKKRCGEQIRLQTNYFFFGNILTRIPQKCRSFLYRNLSLFHDTEAVVAVCFGVVGFGGFGSLWLLVVFFFCLVAVGGGGFFPFCVGLGGCRTVFKYV